MMTQRLINSVDSLSRRSKRAIMILLDLIALYLAILCVGLVTSFPLDTALMLAPLVGLISLRLFGINKIVVSRIGHQSGLVLFLALAVMALVYGVFSEHALKAVLLGGFSFFFVAGWRVLWSMIIPDAAFRRAAHIKHVAIYGAGEAGIQVASSLRKAKEYIPVCFFDDDPELHKQIIMDLHVYNSSSAEKIIAKKKIQTVILAMPSVSRARRQEIISELEDFNVEIQTIPGLVDIVSGKSKISEIKDVDVMDLLGRPPVEPEPELIARNIQGKSVMVTGAGGSIGSELSRQIIGYRPNRLVLFEVSEFALYKIYMEIKAQSGPCEVIACLGTVQDRDLIDQKIAELHIDTLYHAAAYKHVPLVEDNVLEATKNNVFGTYNTALAAQRHKVKNFVLISTDKAVRPSNVMGATKRLAEKTIQMLYASKPERTCFSFVRFGNVLDSSGSVIPLFREQILKGGPVTVTHPDVTRYFMTIPEAVQLVLQASSMAKGGEGFILDMGEPVRIKDIAYRMIRLSGLHPKNADNPKGDIEITYTGLRPGEKLHEELFLAPVQTQKTTHSRISCEINDPDSAPSDFSKDLKQLEKQCFHAGEILSREMIFRFLSKDLS